MSSAGSKEGGLSRRDALRAFVGGSGSLAAVAATASGCGQASPPAETNSLRAADAVSVPLADLGPGARVVVRYGETPVEVRRVGDADEFEALSLLCTHQGCRVSWKDDIERYQCACHEGQFDIDGKPVAGLPSTPLWRVPVVATATAVVVGGRRR